MEGFSFGTDGKTDNREAAVRDDGARQDVILFCGKAVEKVWIEPVAFGLLAILTRAGGSAVPKRDWTTVASPFTACQA